MTGRPYSHRDRPIILGLLLACSACASAQRNPDIARSLSADLGLQGRVLWVDGTANIERVTNLAGIRDIVAHCKKANIQTIVLDVKPVVGQVLYNSRIAEHLTQWKGKAYPDFDALAAMVDEAHKAGIEVAASFNVFSEGHKATGSGLAYRKPEWQSVAYSVERSLATADGSKLLVRGVTDPVEPGKALVYGDDYVVQPSPATGGGLAVALDGDSRVAGVVDPGLLGDEPMAAPEDGHVMVMSSAADVAWATQHLRAGEETRFAATAHRLPVTEAASEKIAAFVSPLNTDARAYELSLLQEVAKNYAVDGIVFDRMRYANLYNDYSDLSRAAFEKWLGKPVERWPEDVIRFSPLPDEPVQRGPLYKPWLEFRARTIRGFLREATDSLRAIRPAVKFGVYVGSWYREYYGVGVNWGSERFPVQLGWASADYDEAGYAELLDWISTGCYYPIPTREEARQLQKSEGATVEAAAELSVTAVQNATPVYAGVYALDYAKRPADFSRAISVAAKRSQGVMIFDVSYIYDYDWWPLLEQAFSQPAVSPHLLADFTAQVRSAQDGIR